MTIESIINSGASTATIYLLGIILLLRYIKQMHEVRIDHLETRADTCERDRNELRKEMVDLAGKAALVDPLCAEIELLKKKVG